jgi:hypothetical protein
MIIITVPIITPDDKLKQFRDHLEHLVNYHLDYIGLKFLVEKAHLSLVKIEITGELNRSHDEESNLLSHIQENIREYLSYVP